MQIISTKTAPHALTLTLYISASEDYDAVIQNISFAAFSSGSQQQCFNAFTNQDTTAEGLEAFRATIADTGDSRVILGNPAVAVVNIIDDDCTYTKLEQTDIFIHSFTAMN